MADILCPVCGKPNPQDHKTCQFCQAPLKGIQPEAIPASDAEMPEWLRQVMPAEIANPPAEPAAPGGQDEAEPEWLSSLLGTPAEPEAPAAVTPDWLAQAPAPVSPFTLDTDDAQTDQAAPSEGSSRPDWLARLSATEEPAVKTPAFSLEDEGYPESGPGGDDRVLSTLPDWVSQLSAEQPEPAADEAESGLTPAELPGWLEAMRPVDTLPTTAPSEDLTNAEMVAAGPLIGLRGVLSAEPDAIRAHKTTGYSLKVRVTEEQHNRLALLEDLLKGEQRSKPLPASPAITPQYVFRLVITLALLLPVLWIVINQSKAVPAPSIDTQPGVLPLDSKLRGVQPGEPVLLAIDYEAGFSGEMELVARSLLRRLDEQNAYVVMMSTNTTGPALAERMLDAYNRGRSTPLSQITNLGYLPGGALGLAGLARAPRQALPYALTGAEPWLTAPLDAVGTLTDFKLVMVITNDAETARNWIEQVGPALKDENVPLLMAVSSQAEAMVRPYYEGASPLVTGLMVGLAGSVALESHTGYGVTGREIWDGYSISMTVSALIILFGSLVGAVLTAIRQNQPVSKPGQPPERESEPKQEQP